MNLGLGNLGYWRFFNQSFCLLLLFCGIGSLVIGVVDIIGACSHSSSYACNQDDLTGYSITSVEKSYFQPCVSNKKKNKNNRFSVTIKTRSLQHNQFLLFRTHNCREQQRTLSLLHINSLYTIIQNEQTYVSHSENCQKNNRFNNSSILHFQKHTDHELHHVSQALPHLQIRNRSVPIAIQSKKRLQNRRRLHRTPSPPIPAIPRSNLPRPAA